MKLMRNKVFLFLVAGAAALGIAGGIAIATTTSNAFAHGGFGSGGSADAASFAAKVAEKLNEALSLDEDITEAQVQTAFNGVVSDQQDTALEARLVELEAEDDVKTEITDWFDDYPYSDLIRLRIIGLASSDTVSSHLERLVEKERITQAQSDGIQSWYDDRPDLPEGLERSGHGKRRGDGDGANTRFRGRHGHGGDNSVGSFFRGRFGRGGGDHSTGSSM
ncbi:MAG: hypothetical protein OXI91_04190 [Chloroflexota bacterium]|nr:hypothetical protein [Chloroflexota bacterium]